jgi:hypothetical protein
VILKVNRRLIRAMRKAKRAVPRIWYIAPLRGEPNCRRGNGAGCSSSAEEIGVIQGSGGEGISIRGARSPMSVDDDIPGDDGAPICDAEGECRSDFCGAQKFRGS